MVNHFVSSVLAWDITTFLTNATTTLKSWGSLLMILIGVVMVIVAIWQIATGLISHGKKPTNWFVAILLLLVGGALAAFSGNAAWDWVSSIAAGGKKTIDDLGGGGTPTTPTIIFYGNYLKMLLP